MVFYKITLTPLSKELMEADLVILYPFYADTAAFYGSERRSAKLLKLLMGRGLERGYLPKPYKSILFSDTPGQEEAENREFAAEGLELNFVRGSRYLGAYLVPQ